MGKTSICYVHIGAPKTGTTALQKLLSDNVAALAASGFLYPTSSLRGYGHHDIAYLLAGGYPEYATPQPRSLDEIAAALTNEVARHSGSIVLSSENFYLFPRPRATHDFLERTGCLAGRSCAIVIYVRRQDDAHESWFNQTIKAQGFTHDLQACVDQWFDLWDYQKQLDSWAEVFGVQALIVRPYEVQQFVGGSLGRDFSSIIDVEIDVAGDYDERINGGLNRDILEFQRVINALPLTIQEKRRFHRQLIELSERSKGYGLFNDAPLMNGAGRRALLERYAQGNAAVAKTYLRRDNLFLADAPPDSNQDANAPAALTADKLALILGWLLSRER